MGSFAGHALPGSFFLGFALWWTVQMFNRYYTCLRRNKKFKSTPTFELPGFCGSKRGIEIEPFLKLFLSAVGIFLEIYTGYNFTVHKFTTPGNAQHATMFFFFGMSGVLDILAYYKSPLPKDLDYVMVLLALGIEGILFHYHLHGRNALDVRVHTLLIYAIVGNIIGLILEMKYRHNVLAALSRTFFFLVQGTWFWQIGFVLYNLNPDAEKWMPDNENDMLMITMYFTWHCGIDFLIMLGIGCCVAFYHKKVHQNKEDEFCMKRLIKTRSNGETVISMGDSDESDIEYQKLVTK